MKFSSCIYLRDDKEHKIKEDTFFYVILFLTLFLKRKKRNLSLY